nr:PREDICTED: uncharacterized protein LOC102364587 [Latimeria chalumnae]|eukprot:XP_006011135.1 PREDICTED: uncharacterized protein LOC102364587 [Latimeria chalumnae]
MPWLMPERNVTKQPVTLIDVCYGKMDNLNMQYVSALESKLSKLFKHLHAVRQTLSFILAPGQGSQEQAHHILPPAVYARLINHVTMCNRSLEDCCRGLLILTLIVPSAPWAKLEYKVSQEFTVENVLSVLPAFPKGAPQQRARRAAEALVKAANYSKLMAMQQVDALQAELNFHRTMYSLQVNYTEALFQGIRQAYHAFQENVAEVLCSPLQDVLCSYMNLKTTASEAALRDFLTVFKSNAEQMQDAVNALNPSKTPQNEGDEALSRFEKEFFHSLENSLKDCGKQRDKAASELEALKAEFDQVLDSLQTLRKERKEKGAGSSQQSLKSEGESVEGSEGSAGGQVKEASSKGKMVQSTAGGRVVTLKSLKHRQSLVPDAITEKIIGTVSSSPSYPSHQQQSSEREASNSRGKSPHRSKSIRTSARPPWQD